jgi:NADPH:quinone reductase-like Zn-dependent oxidoreductase
MAAIGSDRKMKAIVCHRPTPPAALHVEEIDRPAVPEDGVLVRVHASSVNPVDMYTISRVAHLQRGRKPTVVGTDLAGTVESIGSNVTEFRPGDEVLGAARGSFAQYVLIAKQARLVRKPAGVSFEDAGTLGVAANTALQALRDHGHLQPGQRVLINGASGGVGTFAVQIAKALGAGEVVAVCSTRNVETARGIGADTVIDYTRDDFTRRGERYDLMVDIAGSHSWSDCARVLPRGGTYVWVGAAAVQHGRGGPRRALTQFIGMRVGSIGSGRRATSFIARLKNDDLALLADLVASGRIKPVIEKRYDLAGVPEALEYIEAGHLRGKLAIAVD